MKNNKSTMSENILKPITIGELMKYEEGKPLYNFLIPAYQRGYRWDEDQVTDLLEDLFEFIYETKNDKYCIQPIVVKKLEDNSYEVLDGQQRLTTIYILLKVLLAYLPKIKPFKIKYQTRQNSEIFLDTLKGDSIEINDSNPDFYYITKAYNTISNWLELKNELYPDISSELNTALVKKIDFIWYEIVEDTDPIEVFTRINIGKIPLTNAELVKAVFLSRNNLAIGNDEVDEKWLNITQSKIATEWDVIQNKLSNDHFWGFIYNGKKIYDTRIDYILELITDIKSSVNPYETFRVYYESIREKRRNNEYIVQVKQKNSSLIEEEWNKLKFYIELLEDWFNNNYYYHYLGFLISQNIPIKELIDEYQNKNKADFKVFIEDRIKRLLKDIHLFELDYESTSNTTLLRFLLFYNVVSTERLNISNNRFPFFLYKKNIWSIEHIYAQNSEDLTIDQYETWLSENIASLSKIENAKAEGIVKSLTEGLLKIDELRKDSLTFNNLFTDVSKYYKEEISKIDEHFNPELYTNIDLSNIDNEHSIYNLTLLDRSSNASLSNSLFDVKRTLIIQKDKAGSYIPIETKRVFLKYHTQYPQHLFYWTKQDKVAYVENIIDTIGFYLTK